MDDVVVAVMVAVASFYFRLRGCEAFKATTPSFEFEILFNFNETEFTTLDRCD